LFACAKEAIFETFLGGSALGVAVQTMLPPKFGRYSLLKEIKVDGSKMHQVLLELFFGRFPAV